jgi:hypothetical protein
MRSPARSQAPPPARPGAADARQAKVLTADEALAWNGQTFQDCDAQVRRPIKGKMKCLS